MSKVQGRPIELHLSTLLPTSPLIASNPHFHHLGVGCISKFSSACHPHCPLSSFCCHRAIIFSSSPERYHETGNHFLVPITEIIPSYQIFHQGLSIVLYSMSQIFKMNIIVRGLFLTRDSGLSGRITSLASSLRLASFLPFSPPSENTAPPKITTSTTC